MKLQSKKSARTCSFIIAVTAAAMLIAFSHPPSLAGTVASPYGLFVLGDDNNGGRPIKQSIYASDVVAGVSLRLFWNDVEPSEGSYNWAYFDSEIARATQANKKVTLRVTAGAHTPQWVYSAGAQQFGFAPCRNSSFGCQSGQRVMPVPWDPVYQSKLLDFIRAFGARYANNDRVEIVYMTGPVSVTNETFLPHTRADRDQWGRDGYSPQRYVDAWKAMIDGYAAAFPNQCLGIDLHVPLYAKDGAAEGVLAYGEDKLGKRFCVQHDGLSAKASDKNWIVDKWVTAARDKATIGYQFVSPVSPAGSFNANGARFGGSLDQALQTAVDAGAHYIEIYSLDLKDPHLVDVFRQYKDRLART